MDPNQWSATISRISPHAFGDLDDFLGGFAPQGGEPGRDIFPNPVVLSGSDRSGIERFGFRVDRISGDTAEERAACEDQIRLVWNLDLVL